MFDELLSLAGAEAPQLFVITGSIGTGKTTWCGQLIRLAQARGLRVAGVWSPAVFVDGRKIAIELVDISTNQRRRLAERRGEETGPVATTRWNFDPSVITWGNSILENVPENDLLVIDELGVLEFGQGEGLLAGLRLLDVGAFRVAVVVIRSWLLPDAQARWPNAQIITLNQSGDERESD